MSLTIHPSLLRQTKVVKVHVGLTSDYPEVLIPDADIGRYVTYHAACVSRYGYSPFYISAQGADGTFQVWYCANGRAHNMGRGFKPIDLHNIIRAENTPVMIEWKDHRGAVKLQCVLHSKNAALHFLATIATNHDATSGDSIKVFEWVHSNRQWVSIW